MALYVAGIVSFGFPHGVDVSALSICIVLPLVGHKRRHYLQSAFQSPASYT